MWYTQDAANQSDAQNLSFFDCKDMYEKAYAHRPKVREALGAYRDWLVAHRKLMDPQALAKSTLLGRLMRAEARAQIAKFRADLAEAETLADRYKAQMSPNKGHLAA